MTPALWVTLAVGVFGLVGTILTVIILLRNNKDNLAQKLEEMAVAHREEAGKARNDERNENIKQANIIREELRAERNRVAEELRLEKEKAAKEAERLAREADFGRIEREEFRAEISLLQKQQREIENERAQHKQEIAALKRQHGQEIQKYKTELVRLQATIEQMEQRIKELENGNGNGNGH